MAARRVKEVKAVAEEIEVRLHFSIKHGDDEIASAAVNRFKWDSTFPDGAVKAKVEKGWLPFSRGAIGKTLSPRAPESAAVRWTDFTGIGDLMSRLRAIIDPGFREYRTPPKRLYSNARAGARVLAKSHRDVTRNHAGPDWSRPYSLVTTTGVHCDA
jgi:hypothetical protein